MAKNEITNFNPLINPLFSTSSVGLMNACFEKLKKGPGVLLCRFKVCQQNQASINLAARLSKPFYIRKMVKKGHGRPQELPT